MYVELKGSCVSNNGITVIDPVIKLIVELNIESTSYTCDVLFYSSIQSELDGFDYIQLSDPTRTARKDKYFSYKIPMLEIMGVAGEPVDVTISNRFKELALVEISSLGLTEKN